MIFAVRSLQCVVVGALLLTGPLRAFADPVGASPADRPPPSKVSHKTIESFEFLGALSPTANVRDAALLISYEGRPACTMWYGNLAAMIKNGRPAVAGTRYFPNVALRWTTGSDMHCTADSAVGESRSVDYYSFGDAAARDRFFTSIVNAFAEWHEHFPQACRTTLGDERGAARKTRLDLCAP
jgi:hypothetical protein